jgi:hypothetical protein
MLGPGVIMYFPTCMLQLGSRIKFHMHREMMKKR